jgi:hypothetical protein
MFPGGIIENYDDAKNNLKIYATLRNPQEIVLRWGGKTKFQFCLSRVQEFEQSDATLVNSIIGNIKKAESLEDTPLFNDIINPATRLAVAQRVAPQSASLAASLIRQLERWSEETYEGRPISAAIGIDEGEPINTTVDVDEVIGEGYAVVMASGLESFMIVSPTGQIKGHEPFPNTNSINGIYSPIRFSRLAEWSQGKRSGYALTRNGEIMVFSGGHMRFAKRRGIWWHFPHPANITRFRAKHTFPTAVAKAVYESSLDVSFSRTGGGIGILRKEEEAVADRDKIISPDDRVGSASTKGRFLATIIQGKKFQELDRRLRQDIVAIDGSTILRYDGTIIAAGAIVKVGANAVPLRGQDGDVSGIFAWSWGVKSLLTI